MLKSIELSGFKSFAKRSVIDIDAPTVAVVGPNGSGKSNAAEAFRFVLGEQSIKSMRGKRGEDLIWGGTDLVPRSNRASVRVRFNNSKRLLDIDFDEVVIERIVHRDGANEYFINGSRVRLKDVVTLLAGANIGGSAHHIISQGEADRILNARARERREMLEDALGLKVFQYKKQESEKKLAKTQENIKEIQSARRELAPHLKFLSRQMKKRQRGESLREELRGVLKMYLARENSFIRSEAERLAGTKDGPAAELQTLEVEIAKLPREGVNDNNKDSVVSRELVSKIESLDKQADELSKERSEFDRELGRLEGQVQMLEAAERRASNLEQVQTVSREKVEKFTSEVITESTIAENSREPELLRNALRHIRGLAKGFVEQMGGRSGEDTNNKNIRQQLADLEPRKNELEGKLADLVSAEQRLGEARGDANKSLNKERSKSKDAELKMLELSARRSELRAHLRDIAREEGELMRVKTVFEEQLREAVALLGRATNEYEQISVEETEDMDREAQEQERRRLERMKIKLEEIGTVGQDVVDEYKNVLERSEFLERELKDLDTSGESLLGLIDELEEELSTRFKNGLEKVNEEFQNFFSILFGGGKAKLNLVQQKKRRASAELLNDVEDDEEEQETEEGVEVGVRLPRKREASLEVLSGGERALTSIALIFAMSQVNPPPFLILDETDAALDEANSKRYADMVRVLSEKSQLILITHNRETMAAASELYGVTMGADGVSRLLSVKLDEAVAVAK